MPRTQSQNIASGLGWFSIGLGLAEVAAPGAVASLVGLPGNSATRNVLRVFGIRELATGIGILKNPGEPGWIWARVAGDALDIAALWTGAQSNGRDTARSATATAALIGLTVMDAFCGAQLSTASKDAGERNGSKAKRSNRVSRSIIVDRPVEEVYRFWHDFGNLPKFMTFLESVESTGDRRSHWTANGPAGAQVEWDADIVVDEPNREIAWRSAEGAPFKNSGSVRFEPAPGNRGTLVRVEMEYAPFGVVFPSVMGKMLGVDVGQRIQHDLRNFKQVLELGEVTRSDASIHAAMHPARPANGHA